jgi:hypothetical protein
MTPPTLVVLAHCDDQVARALVERWAAHNARLITPEDVSMVGWRYRPGTRHNTRVVSDGEVIDAQAITGLLVRLPQVIEQDVLHIAAEDRAYVAAEMTAFLRAWLNRLPCRVLNRPTAMGLHGPLWRHERWIHTAAQLGCSVIPAQRATSSTQPSMPAITVPSAVVTVTIVGSNAIGDADPALVQQARRLAEVAQVELLSVAFDGPGAQAHFIGASLWPDMTQDAIADAVLDLLSSGT